MTTLTLAKLYMFPPTFFFPHFSEVCLLYLWNLVSPWQAFLETRLEEHFQWQGQISHYIFTDSDVAVVDDLGQIFNNYLNFHLVLTFRNNKDQPLNSGFIAVRGTPDGIRRCVNRMLISLYDFNLCSDWLYRTT